MKPGSYSFAGPAFGLVLLGTACPGEDSGDGRAGERLARALLEAPAGTADDCQAQAAALAVPDRPQDLVGAAEAALRVAGLHARLHAVAGSDPRLESACAAPVRRTMWELCLRAHKAAQGRQSADAGPVAEALYRVYLEQFPSGEHTDEARFYRAELLWAGERWREAAEQYTAVAEKDPRGRFAKEAAYAAILARKNALGPEKPQEGGEPWPLSAEERALVDAFDLYLRVVPDAPERVKVEYRRARIHYEHGLYDQALPLFAEIVDRYPEQELAVYAANLLLDVLKVTGREGEIPGWVAKFLKDPALMADAEFARQMRGIESDSLDLEGRSAHRRGAFAVCGRAMKAAADAQPEHAKHAERLFNAVQ
jgi:tetratricopeptide (TPR) repeat protein